MKQAKRIIALCLAMLLIAVSVPYAFAASLNYTSKNLYYGKTLKLKATSGTAYAWSSSNSDVATVNEKGTVKGVGLGTAVITAKVGGQTVSCKVKVKDRNVPAAVSFKSSTGGAFINKVNEAVIGVKPLKYNAAKATVYVKDAADTIVYKTTLTNLTKNVGVYPHWNGKNNKGVVVPNGTYTVYVKIGKQVSKSNALAFLNKNYFAAGDGSAKNPFQVATVDQLKQIVRYPNAYFKQTKNLDCGYESVGGFFTEDQPFNGVYDGNNKKISNIYSNTALFFWIGKKGTLKKIIMNNCSITNDSQKKEEVYAVLASENHGVISNCNIDGIVTSNDNALINAAIICATNQGTITNCVASGMINCTGKSNEGWATNAIAGGFVCGNHAEGKIISSVSHVNVSAVSEGTAVSGGAVGINRGIIQHCEADGTIYARSEKYGKPSYAGGIAGFNESQIIDSTYTGLSKVGIAGENQGIIA